MKLGDVRADIGNFLTFSAQPRAVMDETPTDHDLMQSYYLTFSAQPRAVMDETGERWVNTYGFMTFQCSTPSRNG